MITVSGPGRWASTLKLYIIDSLVLFVTVSSLNDEGWMISIITVDHGPLYCHGLSLSSSCTHPDTKWACSHILGGKNPTLKDKILVIQLLLKIVQRGGKWDLYYRPSPKTKLTNLLLPLFFHKISFQVLEALSIFSLPSLCYLKSHLLPLII